MKKILLCSILEKIQFILEPSESFLNKIQENRSRVDLWDRGQIKNRPYERFPVLCRSSQNAGMMAPLYLSLMKFFTVSE